jgi:serine phosphatase RsbU (regulator of sigma subunit)/Tfp pilus assembly protein PilF
MKKQKGYCSIFFLFLLIAVFFNPANSLSNVTDSLLIRLNKAAHFEKFDIFIQLTNAYLSINIDSAGLFANMALALAFKNGDNSQIGLSYKKKGLIHYYLANNPDAIVNYNLSLRYFKKSKNNLELANVYNNLGLVYFNKSDYSSALEYYNFALSFYKDANDSSGYAACIGNIGNVYTYIGDYEKALTCQTEAYTIALAMHDKSTQANSLNNCGLIYHYWGKFEKAVENYISALRIMEEIDDQRGIGQVYLNLGTIYFIWNDNYSKALECYNKAVEIQERLEDYSSIIKTYSDIGELYDAQKKDSKAIEAYNKAIEIARKSDMKKDLANCYYNLGSFHEKRMNYDKAISFYQKSLLIRQEINDPEGICNSYLYLGQVLNKNLNFNEAINYLNKCKELAERLNIIQMLSNCYLEFYNSYKSLNNLPMAINYIEKFNALSDSLMTKNYQNQVTELQIKFETEEKDKEITLLSKEKEVQQLKLKEKEIQNKRQKTIIFFAFVILTLVLAFSFIVVKQYHRIKKANILLDKQNKEILERDEEIKTQSEIILEQNIEITDSIYYASRIQKAILPDDKYLDSIMHEHFVLYMPKNIVSGDFYMIRRIGTKILAAAADCTGHGVPGAFMSMLGVSFMNEIINKAQLTDASTILNELRKHVKDTLSQTGKEDEAKDGMDIALAIIDESKKELQFAGAYNPAYLFMNNEFIEIKADKMPIGIHIEEKETFTNNIIKLNGECDLYLFSDGYADQFGGQEGGKFKTKKFRELISNIHSNPMNEQKMILKSTIETWMNFNSTEGTHYVQTDDISVMGIRIHC